jgi:hypothetical protein
MPGGFLRVVSGGKVQRRAGRVTPWLKWVRRDVYIVAMNRQNNRPRRAIPLDVTAKRKRASVAREETVEDRLIGKAKIADRTDYTSQHSLGQMSFEEFCATLSVDP